MAEGPSLAWHFPRGWASKHTGSSARQYAKELLVTLGVLSLQTDDWHLGAVDPKHSLQAKKSSACWVSGLPLQRAGTEASGVMEVGQSQGLQTWRSALETATLKGTGREFLAPRLTCAGG